MEHIKRIKRELAYKGSILEFYKDTMVTPDGKVTYWDHIEHKGAAAVVPVLDDGRIVLVRQYRNSPDEETRYKAERKNVKKLISVYTAVAFCNEIIDIYVADKLIRTCQNLDDEESINVEIYTLDEIKRMIFDGTIKDSKTVSAMMAYSDMISRI